MFTFKETIELLHTLRIYPSKKQVVKLLWNIFTSYHDEIEKMGFDNFLNEILKRDSPVERL